jgi:cell wall-associated NlpC family hydrolase
MRDYLKTKNMYLPPRVPFEEGWWEKKGLNYFCPEVIKGWGGKEISSPQENDVLIFTVDSGVPNHCGVYIGNDTFFHHARNRLSCREHLYPFWIKHLTGVYRYDANSLS